MTTVVKPYWQDLTVPAHAPPIFIDHNLGTRDVFVEVRYAAPTEWAQVGDFQLHRLTMVDENRVRLDGLPPATYRIMVAG